MQGRWEWSLWHLETDLSEGCLLTTVMEAGISPPWCGFLWRLRIVSWEGQVSLGGDPGLEFLHFNQERVQEAGRTTWLLRRHTASGLPHSSLGVPDGQGPARPEQEGGMW